MKNQKGITLIALVVTIVVLLILAGTSIAMLSGENGIITNAQNANYANTEGEILDKINLAFNTVSTEVRVKSATEVSYDAISATEVANLVKLIKDDLGMTDTDTNGYTVTTSPETIPANNTNDVTITISYSDSNFGSGKKFNAISNTFTISSSKVTLGDYTRQVSTSTK